MDHIPLDQIRLENLKGFRENTAQLYRAYSLSNVINQKLSFALGIIYCPRCGQIRRVNPTFLRVPGLKEHGWAGPGLLVLLHCVQCDATFTAVTFNGIQGEELAIFPSVPGGLSTPNTPPGVSYYLDQASRAQSVGARSAAVAMYRAALEHLLHDQGYTKGMLHQKITALENDVQSGQGPAWARTLDPAYLVAIKELGNASIHTNDGDITVQAELDNHVLELMSETFAELLHTTYEEPLAKAARLQAMQAKVAKLK